MFPLLLLESRAGHLRAQETRVLEGQECRPHQQPWQTALFQGVSPPAPLKLLSPIHTSSHPGNSNQAYQLSSLRKTQKPTFGEIYKVIRGRQRDGVGSRGPERVCVPCLKSQSTLCHMKMIGAQRGCVESHIASWWAEKRGQGLRRHLTLSHLDLRDLPNRYLWVLLGKHHLQKWERPQHRLLPRDLFPHPGFNPDLSAQDHNDDIMLIRLSRKAFLGPAVQPLKLSRTCIPPGTQCLISGWAALSSPQGTALSTTHTLCFMPGV
ncbi:kallikrein-11-like [Physeter macrocephalus]|uniref:Kallikrein-11-like n=1 Tax=Physeter macrocephalus TaxID=9755 RepID=A0A9W2WL19_PHYMC|nr:kallikrein-11-like [Physeter catodon]